MESSRNSLGVKKKLSLEREEAIDPLFHLFTEIPLTSLERDPDFFSKSVRNNINSVQPPSQRSSSSLNHGSSIGSVRRLNHSRIKTSLNEPSEKLQTLGSKQKADVIKLLRIEEICKTFITKLKRNRVQGQSITEEQVRLIKPWKKIGITIPESLNFVLEVLNTILMVILMTSQTSAIAFPELLDSSFTIGILMFGALFFIIQIILGFAAVKYEEGKKIDNLSEIVKIYMKQLPLDLTLLVLLSLMMAKNQEILNQIFVLAFLLKLPNFHNKIKSIQRIILRNTHLQKVWPFFKIIMLNLCICHAISIALNLMAATNTVNNWQIQQEIFNSWWFERYVWSYYWSVAIITTVGFGGITPANYGEAICIIFIEIMCFFLLAYNLTFFGRIIAKSGKINKSLKIVENMTKKGAGDELKQKVIHYLEQKEDMDEKFNISEQKALMETLPQELKKEVERQSVCSIKKLSFFNQLHLKTIYQLSQCFERNIYLPNQIIKPFEDPFNINILEKGEVGYLCHRPSSRLHNVLANSVKRQQKQNPFLLSLDFISFQRLKLVIRATTYSVILQLPFACFKSALSISPRNLEYYCFLRDRAKSRLDEFETIECNVCSSKHTKDACPRLHYIPIKQLVIAKHLKKASEHKEIMHPCDISCSRIMRRKMNSLNINKICQSQYAKIVAPTIKTNQERKEISATIKRPSTCFLDPINTHSLWKASQSSFRQSDWASFLSLQLSNELKSWDRVDDEVWLVASDSIQDYKAYFPEANLEAITKKRSLLTANASAK